MRKCSLINDCELPEEWQQNICLLLGFPIFKLGSKLDVRSLQYLGFSKYFKLRGSVEEKGGCGLLRTLINGREQASSFTHKKIFSYGQDEIYNLRLLFP